MCIYQCIKKEGELILKFIAIGDNCMDVYSQTGEVYAGGNSVNFSVYVKQLEEESSYLGIVGQDEYGDSMIKAIGSKGVDVTHLHKAEGKTAITQVELVNGDRILGDYDEGVFEKFKLSEEDLEFIKGHDILHTAIWGKCENYLKELKDNLTICFDFADKTDSPKIREVSPYIHYAFISYHEDNDFIRKLLKDIKNFGPKCVVATLGEHGSLAYDGVDYYKHGIMKVNAIDTLGAGDSFIAGFMVGVSRADTIEDCLKMGTKKASETITYFGAW